MSRIPKHHRLQTVVLGGVLIVMLAVMQAHAGPVQVFQIDTGAPVAYQVSDLCPGPCAGVRNEAAIYGDRIVFSGMQEELEDKLWTLRSDGTLTPIGATNPGGRDNVDHFMPLGDKLVFRAFNPGTGHELWQYNGSNISLLYDFAPGSTSSYVRPLMVYNGDLLVSAETDTDRGVFKFGNGTTELLGRGKFATDAKMHDGDAWVSFDEPQFGHELWHYDGNNFTLAQDIEPGSDGSWPNIEGTIAGELVYSAREWHGQGMFMGDLSRGTIGSYNTVIINDELYYGGSLGNLGDDGAQHLIRFDGATQVPLTNGRPFSLGTYKNTVYYSAWLNGPTTANTFRYHNGIAEPITTATPGERLTASRTFLELGGKLFFQAHTPGNGLEWWGLEQGATLSKLQMQLIPIWDNRYLWQLDLALTGKPLALTYAVYQVTPKGEVMPLDVAHIYLDEHTGHSNFQKASKASENKDTAIATLIVGFDSKSQRKLFQHVEVSNTGKSTSAQAIAQLQAKARAFGQALEFKSVQAGVKAGSTGKGR